MYCSPIGGSRGTILTLWYFLALRLTGYILKNTIQFHFALSLVVFIPWIFLLE